MKGGMWNVQQSAGISGVLLLNNTSIHLLLNVTSGVNVVVVEVVVLVVRVNVVVVAVELCALVF